MFQKISKNVFFGLLVASWLFFFIALANFGQKVVLVDVVKKAQIHTEITDDDLLYGDKTDFSYSPDKKYIAFVENVFEEFGEDYDKYWALKILDIKTRKEKTLLIDDSPMHNYAWESTTTVRVIQSLGTGVRGYRDVNINLEKPDTYKDYIRAGREIEFWTPDDPYAHKFRDDQLAREAYYSR